MRHCSSQQLSGTSAAVSAVPSAVVGLGEAGGGLGGDGCEATGVDGEEKQPKLGVALVVEDVVEVELDVRLLGQAGGVAQEPQGVSVGHDAPQVRAGPVEQVLQHGLRCPGRDPVGVGVEWNTCADQVQRNADGRLGEPAGQVRRCERGKCAGSVSPSPGGRSIPAGSVSGRP
jgi:hypothetical protein